MALRKLTPHLAFKAAFDLQQEQVVVNGHTLWLKTDKLGSLTTAKKWADLWNSLERGEKASYNEQQQAYEAVKRGEASQEAPELEEPIPVEVQTAFNCVFSFIRNQFEAEATQTREFCSALVEEANAEKLQAISAREQILADLEKALSWEVKFLESQQQLAALNATLAELHKLFESFKLAQKTSEQQKIELSERLGQSLAVSAELQKKITQSEQRYNEICQQLEANLISSEKQRESQGSKISMQELQIGELTAQNQALTKKLISPTFIQARKRFIKRKVKTDKSQ